MERPDLNGINPNIVIYIEALEAEVERLRRPRKTAITPEPDIIEPAEPPTTQNVVTISGQGLIKRTPRHYYHRQRRGGMGVFDLDIPGDDAPAFLTTADESGSLVIITSNARAFRFDLDLIPESPVRSRGQSLTARLALQSNERLISVLPADAGSYLLLVTDKGHVRRFVGHNFGASMRPGTVLFDTRQIGAPAAACWSGGDSHLFIATRSGRGIRFSEKQVPVRGCLGMRLEPEDVVVGIASVQESSAVALISADGKGTLRLVSGFRANKSPGAAGKTTIKTDALVGIVRAEDDLFVISRLGKIIRFRAEDVPAKNGVVQGVNCMELRADEVVAFVSTH